MQQLVETVKYPIGFLSLVGQTWKTCRQSCFCPVDEEMSAPFHSHGKQNSFPRNRPKQQANRHQPGMDNRVQHDRPWVAPVSLCPDHSGYSEAEIGQIVADKEGYEQQHHHNYLLVISLIRGISTASITCRLKRCSPWK